MMTEQIYRTLAMQLCTAEKEHNPIERLSVAYPEITIEDAYRIQLEAVKCKEAAGQAVVGKKIGFTNLAIQKSMNINEPDYGHVFDAQMAAQDVPIRVGELIQPHIEAELAFMLHRDVKGPGVTEATIMASTAGIMAAIEIVDIRYKDMKIALQDTVADNAACGRIVLGSRLVPIAGMDLRTIGLVLEKNGQILDTGVSASVLGNPAAAVAWLANKMAVSGVTLKAGELIMSGSFTRMYPVAAGENYAAHFGGIGSVKASFVE